MTEKLPPQDEPEGTEEHDADQLEKKLIEAMKDLGRQSRKVEEYLEGLSRSTDKTPKEDGSFGGHSSSNEQ